MQFLSVCSGIESASLAWAPLGWRAWALSEVDPFACAVLAARWPGATNLGDLTKWKTWSDAATINVLCAGTPCQSFSVAGTRSGMVDPRGALALSFCAVAAKYSPRWLVWENVPGVLSVAGGADFARFLATLGQCGYGYAWRVLDARHFGIPQRRRRLWLVGHLGAWQPACAVLFDRAGIAGHPRAREASRGTAAGTLSAGAHAGSYNGRDAYRNLLIVQGQRVRRLTPLEWERLQGLPDNYTAIDFRGKPATDARRYRAIGNAWPVPVARWIGERIAQVQALLRA